MKECLDSNIKLSEICIAAPSMNLLKEMQSRLHHDGTDYRVLKGTQKQGCSNGVDLCTFHSLKGLEYRVVILMGVNGVPFIKAFAAVCCHYSCKTTRLHGWLW